MSATILDGKALATSYQNKIKEYIKYYDELKTKLIKTTSNEENSD